MFDGTLGLGWNTATPSRSHGRRLIIGDLTSANYSRARGGGTDGGQHAAAGQRRRHHEDRDDPLDEELARSELRARLILQVHDELVLEVDRPDVAAVAELVQSVMEGAAELSVPSRPRSVPVQTGTN